MPSLRIKLPENKGEVTHVLAGERITIGRRPDNTIQIIDRTVSGHHAELISTNGHYRLHDLGSTNLTCVDGQPVTDYHLHQSCKVSFGTVECDYTLDATASTSDKPGELVPTRSEMEFLRRENLDLQAKLAALQKQIDILNSARLITKETSQLGIAPEAHRRIVAQRDELRATNEDLRLENETLHTDLTAITRDRDATRQAWETVKSELAAAQAELTRLRAAAPATPASPSPPVATPSAEPERPAPPLMSPDAHRAMATVLTKAPSIIQILRTALEKLASGAQDNFVRQEAITAAEGLAEAAAPIKGHPVQRLADSIHAFARELAAADGAWKAGCVRTLSEAVELARLLLDPRHLRRVKDLTFPQALAIDHNPDLLAALTSALETAGIQTTGLPQPADAIALLQTSHVDLVLLDTGFTGEKPADIYTRIRDIPACKTTPVILLTTGENAAAGISGANDSLAKPFQLTELSVKAHTWIYRGQFGLI